MASKLSVWKKTNGLCWYCGIKLEEHGYTVVGKKRNMNAFSVDHVVPKKLGGNSHIDNCVPSCITCNIQKRGKSLEDYREWLRWQRIGGKFTDGQVKWLADNDVAIPEPPQPIFYFEQV